MKAGLSNESCSKMGSSGRSSLHIFSTAFWFCTTLRSFGGSDEMFFLLDCWLLELAARIGKAKGYVRHHICEEMSALIPFEPRTESAILRARELATIQDWTFWTDMAPEYLVTKVCSCRSEFRSLNTASSSQSEARHR
jgi:hypothetical protein